MPRLENWAMDDLRAFGEIYDDDRFKDGANVATSIVREVDYQTKKLYTTNTMYDLGEPTDGYRKHLKSIGIEF